MFPTDSSSERLAIGSPLLRHPPDTSEALAAALARIVDLEARLDVLERALRVPRLVGPILGGTS
jgi:hypothetical protein